MPSLPRQSPMLSPGCESLNPCLAAAISVRDVDLAAEVEPRTPWRFLNAACEQFIKRSGVS